MKWLISGGIAGIIILVASVISISSDDNILSEQAFKIDTVNEQKSQGEIIFKNPNTRIISYNVDPIPNISNKESVQFAIEEAIASWEKENNNLEFEKTDNFPDIQIEWQTIAVDSHAGLATYSEKYKGVITVGLGKFDCNDEFVQYDRNLLQQTIMHEVGHILGLGHHPENTHLMYGISGINVKSIDNFEYTIPQYRDGFFEGYIELESNYNILDSKLEELTQEIERLENQYVVMNEEYETVLPKLEEDVQYLSQVNLMEQEMAQVNYKIYSVIDEHDDIVFEMNKIVDKMSCFPDVE